MAEHPAAELALPEAASSRLRFDRAAPSFRSACFMHDEARLQELEKEAAGSLGHHIVDHLRASGAYSALAARVREKQELLGAAAATELPEHGPTGLRGVQARPYSRHWFG